MSNKAAYISDKHQHSSSISLNSLQARSALRYCESAWVQSSTSSSDVKWEGSLTWLSTRSNQIKCSQTSLPSNCFVSYTTDDAQTNMGMKLCCVCCLNVQQRSRCKNGIHTSSDARCTGLNTCADDESALWGSSNLSPCCVPAPRPVLWQTVALASVSCSQEEVCTRWYSWATSWLWNPRKHTKDAAQSLMQLMEDTMHQLSIWYPNAKAKLASLQCALMSTFVPLS